MATRERTERDAVDVILDAEELAPPMKVGTLRFSRARTDLPASFEYDAAWLNNGNCFQLDPRLELFAGDQHPPSNSLTFGIFQDAAPDRWGRMVMERREGVLARRERRKVRRLGEMDFLLGVHDLTRSGALRFRLPPGGRWLTMLIAPGTSLVGARPKASFSEVDGSLWIGKFPAREDRYDDGSPTATARFASPDLIARDIADACSHLQ